MSRAGAFTFWASLVRGVDDRVCDEVHGSQSCSVNINSRGWISFSMVH